MNCVVVDYTHRKLFFNYCYWEVFCHLGRKLLSTKSNLLWSNATIAGGLGSCIGPYSGGARRLFVDNLHFNIAEDQLPQVFGTWAIWSCWTYLTTYWSRYRHCKGFKFVQLTKFEDSWAAKNLNKQPEIVHSIIKVSVASDQIGIWYLWTIYDCYAPPVGQIKTKF